MPFCIISIWTKDLAILHPLTLLPPVFHPTPLVAVVYLICDKNDWSWQIVAPWILGVLRRCRDLPAVYSWWCCCVVVFYLYSIELSFSLFSRDTDILDAGRYFSHWSDYVNIVDQLWYVASTEKPWIPCSIVYCEIMGSVYKVYIVIMMILNKAWMVVLICVI